MSIYRVTIAGNRVRMVAARDSGEACCKVLRWMRGVDVNLTPRRFADGYALFRGWKRELGFAAVRARIATAKEASEYLQERRD